MKKETLILSFPNATAAMKLKQAAAQLGIPGTIVPVPRSMKAGCGLAWAAAPEAEEALRRCMAERDIPWDGLVVMPYLEVV